MDIIKKFENHSGLQFSERATFVATLIGAVTIDKMRRFHSIVCLDITRDRIKIMDVILSR